MKENRYDDPAFFEKYSQMQRSQQGLAGAGEWPALQKMLPPLAGKRLLDLGCGYGWHCIYAMQQGAASAVGIDISEKMLEVAREKTPYKEVAYRCMPFEEMDFGPGSFDVVLSSLALHYTPDFEAICRKVHRFLVPGGWFIFSVEHPVFTAYGSQDWLYNNAGEALCWPVDRYFYEGQRTAVFLGEEITKYHHTLTTFLGGLLNTGFAIAAAEEPQPTAAMLEAYPAMQEELRRPMMLLVAARKNGPEGQGPG